MTMTMIMKTLMMTPSLQPMTLILKMNLHWMLGNPREFQQRHLAKFGALILTLPRKSLMLHLKILIPQVIQHSLGIIVLMIEYLDIKEYTNISLWIYSLPQAKEVSPTEGTPVCYSL